LRGDSPFIPVWQLEFDSDGTPVYSEVRADVDLSGDADEDGQTDGDELYSGQDPSSALSVFSIEGGRLHGLGPDKLLISWPSTNDLTYTVYSTERIGQPFSIVASGIEATPPMNMYTDTVSSALIYYRVEVE